MLETELLEAVLSKLLLEDVFFEVEALINNLSSIGLGFVDASRFSDLELEAKSLGFESLLIKFSAIVHGFELSSSSLLSFNRSEFVAEDSSSEISFLFELTFEVEGSSLIFEGTSLLFEGSSLFETAALEFDAILFAFETLLPESMGSNKSSPSESSANGSGCKPAAINDGNCVSGYNFGFLNFLVFLAMASRLSGHRGDIANRGR